jgi:hypothetical protein
MAEIKTKATGMNVEVFLNSVEDRQKREDCLLLSDLMKKATKKEPVMWGDSIVGFGTYHYKYESGREGDWFVTGFSPRKNNLTIYLMSGFSGKESYLKELGKHKTSQSCLYVKNLKDIDQKVLNDLILMSVKEISERYP